MPKVMLSDSFRPAAQAKIVKYIDGPLQLHVSPKGLYTWYELRGGKRIKLGRKISYTEALRRSSLEVPDASLDEVFARWSTANESLRSFDELERRYKRHISPIGSLALTKIKGHHILAIKTRLARTPVLANRVLKQVSGLFKWATDMGLYSGPNPAKTVKLFREHSRDRFLTSEELTSLFESLKASRIGAMVLFAITTGQRISNVRTLEASEIEGEVWTIPASKSKNETAIKVPLSTLAQQCLVGRLDARDVWAISNSVLRCDWNAVLKQAGLKNVRLHDLRRTFATLQLEHGATLSQIGASLGHKSTAVTQVYARANLNQVRENSQRVSEVIQGLLPQGTTV